MDDERSELRAERDEPQKRLPALEQAIKARRPPQWREGLLQLRSWPSAPPSCCSVWVP
jgi:hypothetical protein